MPPTDRRLRTLAALRRKIDAADRRLLAALATRAALVDRLWAWKRAQGLPRVDAARERAVLRALVAEGARQGLARAPLRRVLEQIVGHRLRR